jgi:hypothetical protein
MPATEAMDFERQFGELVRELRALPARAPERLRERVGALGEPPQAARLTDRLRAISVRRTVLVLAPACVLGLVVAAVVHGVVNSGAKREWVAAQRGAAVGQKQVFGATGVLSPFGSPLPTPSPNRYQDYEAWLRIRVNDLDALTARTDEAMQVARSLGGYVASVEQSTTAGQPGEADLVLRVPVSHVEDALVRLGGLGTVIERHLSIRDLERVVQQQRQRILQLRLFIARATEALKGSLPADVRLRLQLQLQDAQQSLSRATSANTATLREAAMSRISLSLTTQQAVAVTKKSSMGRVERAARDAASFLAGAGAVLLFLLIVLSPVIVLGLVWVFGLRAYRRREERRLLAST